MTPDEVRSRTMRAVKSTNTKPEIVVRRLVHALGYRFRLYRKDLPGSPDLVFPGRRKVIFVHGCFWHHHPRCKEFRAPKSRVEFWRPKLAKNRKRDRQTTRDLHGLRWGVMVVWECELSDVKRASKRIRAFLLSPC